MESGIVRNRALRLVLLVLGLFFVGIGIIGIWVPVVPTTGPILLAAFLFSKSSTRFDQWILQHRVFGPITRDWRAGHGFTVRLKLVAVVAITLSFALTVVFAIDSLIIRVGLILLGMGLIIYILRLPTKPTETPQPGSAVLRDGR
ncbi:MAG: DUF454 domain-containing protein [Acidimicrobiia bacterium]|nr:DUF454 domain-containing protein [Acidimicrobiia bacterium]MYH55650.1 DUF454 domain-containing protein [Acidimicrobiia bacterium]